MRSSGGSYAVAALLALASHASAQVGTICPSSGVCFKLNIPESTTSSGSGDIFFQISAPSSYEWVALGQGSGMSGANIFVVYTNGNGNVTLSPRLGTGHVMPEFNSDAKVTLLEGSGVTGGKMVANVKCSSCNSWSGGSASFSESNGNWIYAFQSSGGAKDTTDQSASINQHSNEDSFRWDYANAKGGSSVNPLINSGTSGGSGTATSCVPRPTSTSRSSDNKREEKRDDDNYCDGSSVSGFTSIGSSNTVTKEKRMLIAHGTLAALAFVIFFPVGAITIRLASFTGLVWLHAAFQTFAYLVYIAAFGLGLSLANDYEVLDDKHPIMGIVVFVLLFFQPIFGFLHHAMFKKHQRRTIWSHAHLWLGRSVVTLGIINGGFGFDLADTLNMGSRTGMIVYSVVAGVIWLVWVAAIVVGEKKRKTVAAAHPPKYNDLPETAPATQRADIAHPENGHYAPK